MKIATWNINSIRARIENVRRWIETAAPDVLLLQEIKCETDSFPRLELEAMGYSCYVLGQKSYNGVALLSRLPVEDIREGLPGDESDVQARYIEATIQGIRIACLYAPNGNPVESEKFDYKLAWMKRLKAQVQALLKTEIPFLLGGDFNVIPEASDAYDPKGWEQDALFHPRTKTIWREILNLSLTDAFRALHPEETAYTFWDYQGGAWQRNLGLRIDHFLLSPEAADLLQTCEIDPAPRGEDKASDHAPVKCSLNLSE